MEVRYKNEEPFDLLDELCLDPNQNKLDLGVCVFE